MKRLLLVVLLAACDATGPVEDVQGTYALSTHAGRPVPTLWTCGSGDIVSGEVELQPVRRARYRLHMTERGSSRDWFYTGEGYYVVRGDVVELQLRGGWSVNGEVHSERYFFEIDNDALIRRHVGAECDGSETEVYTRVAER